MHEYNWWNEALHGVARAGVATVFPDYRTGCRLQSSARQKGCGSGFLGRSRKILQKRRAWRLRSVSRAYVLVSQHKYLSRHEMVQRSGTLRRRQYSSVPYSVVNCKKHKDLNYKIACESIVLLKNDGTLPLDKNKVTSSIPSSSKPSFLSSSTISSQSE